MAKILLEAEKNVLDEIEQYETSKNERKIELEMVQNSLSDTEKDNHDEKVSTVDDNSVANEYLNNIISKHENHETDRIHEPEYSAPVIENHHLEIAIER